MSITSDKMAANARQQWQFAQQLHQELRAKLKEKDSLIGDIEDLMSQLRIACETTLFSDFNYATSENVETVLWDSHSLINNRYRKIVARLKTPDQKKNVVERRKWDKRYADFLKTSQFYYKGYIQRLASHFNGLKELRIIAHRLALSTLSADDAVIVSGDTAHHILLSCHSTLLRLGDLYRYRNDLNTKDRSWEKANAHYSLANDLCPDFGSAFNQMAVISLSDGNHLDAVYNLYRALAVKEPHSLAEKNLEIEFKKITTLWLGMGQKKSSAAHGPLANNPTANMVLWFVRLHAKLYKGEEFSNHDELENEVLSQMTVLLKEQSLEGILDKIVLINIAAEYFAGVRLAATGEDNNFQAYYFFLRLNIRMLFMLLQLLQPELDDVTHGHDVPDVTSKRKVNSTETITAVTRRILPALRQYSTWLVATAPVIAAQIGTAAINIHIKEMWSMYCTTLSLLVTAFPVAQLPDVDYLLEEDAATVGFKPFRDSKDCQIYTYDDGVVKKRSTDPGVERYHPNVEMAARMREILRDGMLLATAEIDGQKQYPIYAVDGQFRFLEDGLSAPSPLLSPVDHLPEGAVQPHSAYSYELSVSQRAGEYRRAPSVDRSESHQSLSTDMYQMVDDLLTPSKSHANGTMSGSNETSYGMHTTTALDVFGSLQDVHQEPYQQMQPRISGFPGFSPSPFSPRPGELQTADVARLTANRRLAALKLDNASPHFSSPVSLQQNSMPSPNSRDVRNNSASPNTSMQHARPRSNIAEQLQQSLAAEYRSSDFSNSSSLYQNTPTFGQENQRVLNDRGSYNMTHNSDKKYGRLSEYDRQMLLQSSAWNGSQPAYAQHGPTPPGGQGS